MCDFRNYLEDYGVDYKIVSNESQICIKECPFCGDNRWKVYFGIESSWGDCKYCNTVFKPVKFIKEREGVEYREACRILLECENNEFKIEPLINNDIKEEDEGIFLPAGELAIDNKYLLSRGLNNDIIKKFNLLKCERGFFKGYIIFPVYDKQGKLKIYQGRDYTGVNPKKYMFPAGFKAKEILYNIWNIPQNPEYCIITEGVFDFFGWYTKGYYNVVSTFGKTVSDIQINILRESGVKNIYLAWDSDAMLEIIKFYNDYKSFFEKIKIVIMPYKKDADEMTKDELDACFLNSRDYNWYEMMNFIIEKRL